MDLTRRKIIPEIPKFSSPSLARVYISKIPLKQKKAGGGYKRTNLVYKVRFLRTTLRMSLKKGECVDFNHPLGILPISNIILRLLGQVCHLNLLICKPYLLSKNIERLQKEGYEWYEDLSENKKNKKWKYCREQHKNSQKTKNKRFTFFYLSNK